MTFGEKIRDKRTKLGLTQAELAEKLGINTRMISMYETGKSFPRTRENYKKIASFFGVNVNYFLAEDQSVEQCDDRGMKQAQKLIDSMSRLFSGGSLSERDKDTVMRAMQDIYWESKEGNTVKHILKKRRQDKK